MNTKMNATVTDRTLHQDWWAALPAGEKEFIRALMGMIKGAKHSQIRDVASAAKKWETAIACFMKVRLKGVRRQKSGVRTGSAARVAQHDRRDACATVNASLLISRSQRGVSLNQD